MILRAKYILAEDLNLIENGFVRIDASRIVEVGRGNSPDAIDCGDAILMPGLVNAHTHLELGGMLGAVPPTHNFVDWLKQLAPKMRSMSDRDEKLRTAVRSGLSASLLGGTTRIGDISRFFDFTRETIAGVASRPVVTSFGEVLGSRSSSPDQIVRRSKDEQFLSATLIPGISPHATYSVPPDVMRECVAVAKKHNAPMCIHAAESLEEVEFLISGTGPMREFLESMGAWDASRQAISRRPIEYLNQVGALGPSTLLAHCNYVDDDEIELLAKSGTSLAYCPRTHHAFGHSPHRFAEMIESGVNVSLGTDSLASNPSISMLDEIRFLRNQRSDVSAETLIRMATINGARSLNDSIDHAGLAHGIRADLIAIPLDPSGPTDPLENILTGSHVPTHCIIAGNPIVS